MPPAYAADLALFLCILYPKANTRLFTSFTMALSNVPGGMNAAPTRTVFYNF